MTPSHALARSEAALPPALQDAAVRSLLGALAGESDRLASAAGMGDVATLDSALDARAALIGALDRTVLALTTAEARGASGTPGAFELLRDRRARLVQATAELQTANVQLLRDVQRECDRLAEAILASDAEDATLAAFGGAARAPAHLDLLR